MLLEDTLQSAIQIDICKLLAFKHFIVVLLRYTWYD